MIARISNERLNEIIDELNQWEYNEYDGRINLYEDCIYLLDEYSIDLDPYVDKDDGIEYGLFDGSVLMYNIQEKKWNVDISNR